MIIQPNSRAGRRCDVDGFTLLELSIALGVMLILAAGIFTLASGGLELLEDVRTLQQRQARQRRFVELCRQNFESLPAGSEISVRHQERGSRYDTYLSLRNAPSAFGFGRGDFEVRRVVLAAESDSSGFLRSTVFYLDADEDRRYESSGLDGLEPRSLLLVPRLRQMRWRFYDASRRDWVDELPPEAENPVMVELSLAWEGDAVPVRSVFWVPARKIEEDRVRRIPCRNSTTAG